MALVEVDVKDRIAVVELNRPEKMNAQNLAMRVEFVDVCAALARRNDVWCVVLTGRGRAFSAGHDLAEVLSPSQEAEDPSGVGIYCALARLPQPVVAGVNGVCLAQGAGLALLADIRVADSSVEFGWPQARRGIASLSGPVIMARLCPPAVAADLLYRGNTITAERALALGMLTEVTPDGTALSRAMEIAADICKSAPAAVRAIKEILVHTRAMPLEDALFAGERMARMVNHTEDAKEGHAAFFEKRLPRWTGM